MLEVIGKGLASEPHSVPLLFVHGGEHAAWCWDEHFLDFFAAEGYRAVALSLRGHGTSSNSKPPRPVQLLIMFKTCARSSITCCKPR
jgi:pimeloyl-ACP methyl ester carboxylesterase